MSNIIIEKKKTLIGQAVDLDRRLHNPIVRLITAIFWIVGAGAFLIIFDNYFLHNLESSKIFGMAVVLLSAFLFYVADRSFYFSKIKHPKNYELDFVAEQIKQGKKFNLFEVFSFELAKTYDSLSKGINSSAEELTLVLLKSPDIRFILLRLGIGVGTISKNLRSDDNTGLEKVILKALAYAMAESHQQIEIGDVFTALCLYDPNLKKLLLDYKIDEQDLLNLVYWQTYIERKIAKEKEFLNPDRLRLTGGIGKDWAFGWTTFLKRFSSDITKQIESNGLNLEIVGHDKEIDEIKEALLRQNGGNAILVGEPGVGKRTTVLGFAKKVLEGETSSGLDFQHIVQVDIDYLMAGITNSGEMTERVSGILNEVASAGNIILFIENIQNMLSSGDAGKINATEVLLPFLDIPSIHVVATCDVGNFNKYILPNTSLMQRFTRVNVEEPTNVEMIRILEDVVPLIEMKVGSIFSYEALKEIVIAADKYIMNIPNPEKSINLLDSVATHANSERGRTIVMPSDVNSYVSQKYEVPAGEAEDSEKTKLLNLEAILHQSVIGQNEAIGAVANALKRARAGVTAGKKPIGSFLFLGPTGVGKTETAKSLARAYFGSEEKMVRFDMSEFQNKEDIYHLIGGNVMGGEIQGVLATAIREHPFSLLLFDEIEKAHKDILDLFLQLLDEGQITDGFGRKISFTNTIIISTSNAGSNIIREAVQNNTEYVKVQKTLLEYLQKENIYRSEFLNRFTSVIVFSPLTQSEIVQVAGLMIEHLKKTMIANKGVQVAVNPDAIAKLAVLGYDPQMGARPMERVIQEKIENLLANKILSNELKKGDSITIGANDIV